ncbi:MAG: phosphotransferase [bacterium]|nr:phosphotransferase [bacterium]
MQPAVRKKQLELARRHKAELIQHYGLRVKKILRNGPRFFVAECDMKHLPVVFKMCLYTKNIDPRTNHGIRREALTLKHFHKNGPTLFRKSTPKVYASGENPRSWYIREYLAGEPQNVKESNFTFKSSFFSKPTADFIVDFFISLHRASQRFPEPLKKNFARHTLQTNVDLIGWDKLEKFIDLPHISAYAKHFLYERERIFDSHQTVLTHYEPYASHFFKVSPKLFYIIDWENVDWGNPAHDISVIWHRSFHHPSWQSYLIKKFHQKTLYRRAFVDLFEVEVIFQSISNLDYFRRTVHPAERPLKKRALHFYQSNIRQVLSGSLSLY